MTQHFLLDANLLSATAPDRRDALPAAKQAARAWIAAHQDRLYLPVTVVAAIAAGIGTREAAGEARHARDLASWLAAILQAWPDRVLPFDTVAALNARALAAEAWRRGLAPGNACLTVACIARAHGLVVATRNRRDFEPLGLAVVNPFDEAGA